MLSQSVSAVMLELKVRVELVTVKRRTASYRHTIGVVVGVLLVAICLS